MFSSEKEVKRSEEGLVSFAAAYLKTDYRKVGKKRPFH